MEKTENVKGSKELKKALNGWTSRKAACGPAARAQTTALADLHLLGTLLPTPATTTAMRNLLYFNPVQTHASAPAATA